MLNSGSTLLLLVALGFLVLMFTRSRRQQRNAVSVQQQIVPGAEVMTGSGLYGRVVELLDGQIVLEIAPGVTSRWDRRAIVRVTSPQEPPPSPDTSEASIPLDASLSRDRSAAPDPTDPAHVTDVTDLTDPSVPASPDGGAPPDSV